MNLESIQPFLILPVVYLTKGIDFNEGNRLVYLRAVFIIVQLATFAFRFLLKQRIVKAGDSREVIVEVPANAISGEPAKKEALTVMEYDLSQFNAELKQSLISLLIIGGIHYKWGYAVPLISQCIMAPLKMYTAKLTKIHFQGEVIPRPFPAPKSAFADLAKAFQGESEEEKKAAAEAKKAKKIKGKAAPIIAKKDSKKNN